MGFRAILFLALLWPPAALAQAPGPPGEVINQGRKALAIVPTDNAALALGPTRWLFVGNSSGTACNVAVVLADDAAAVTFTNVAEGTFMPLRAKVVMATNTTCPNVVGVW